MQNDKIDFIINIAKFNTIITKTFDSSLWWIWFNDFIVLYYLYLSPEKKLRRIDLAQKVWLTASWVTRLLLPMEKIWLVYKESNQSDARVSLVWLASWWENKLIEAIERMNYILDEKIDLNDSKDILTISKKLQSIWAKFLWN